MSIIAKRLTNEKRIEQLVRGNICNIDTDVNYYKASNTLNSTPYYDISFKYKEYSGSFYRTDYIIE